MSKTGKSKLQGPTSNKNGRKKVQRKKAKVINWWQSLNDSGRDKVVAIVATMAVAISVIIAVIVGVGHWSGTKIILPNLIVDGAITSTEDVSTTSRGGSVQIKGDLTNGCEIVSDIGEDLLPTGKNGAPRDRYLITRNGSKYPYHAYDTAWCDVEIGGSYTADGYTDVSLELVDSDSSGYKLETSDNSTFTLKRRYNIYADLENQPDGKPQHLSISMHGKSDNGQVEDNKEILVYSLTITTSLSEENKKFFNDWKTKIDQKKAEENAEKAAKEAEAAAIKAEQEARTKLTYDKFANKIKEGMTINQIQQIFDFDSQCDISTKSGSYVDYSCDLSGSGNFVYAGFTFYKGKLTSKTQLGL